MQKIKFILIGLFLTLTIQSGYAYDNHDFQVWNTDNEEMKIDKHSKLTAEQEFRWGDNASRLFYQHYDIGYLYNLNKYLWAGAGYRHILTKDTGKFRMENEPYLAAFVNWSIAGCALESRNRLEYQHLDYKGNADAWRYRNKFTVKLPWKFTKFEIQPYLGDEGFVRFRGWSGFNQNRAFAGFGASITKNIKADLYYMLQSTKSSGNWVEANVLGTKAKLSF